MRQGQSIRQMAAELDRQERVKRDFVLDTRRIHFVTTGQREGDIGAHSELDLLGDREQEVTGLTVTGHAHRQLSDYLGIPWRYYDRMKMALPGLLDENVNRWLQVRGERRMVRTLDGNARAFLSDRYRRLDNPELARTLLPILAGIPDCTIESCDLTDTRMYIKAITPRVKGEVKVGEEVCAGVFISNSEVGAGSLRVEPFVYTLACTNGMVVSKALGGVALRRIHVGRRLQTDEETYTVFRDETLQADDRAFFMACADVVRAAVDEVRFRDLVEVMKAAAEDRPMTDVVAGVEELAQTEGLNEGERDSVLTHLAAGGDLSRWGLLSAVTRTAEDSPNYDRATELEELGGKLLAYSPGEWRRITAATV